MPNRVAWHLVVIGIFIGFLAGLAVRTSGTSNILFAIAAASALSAAASIIYVTKMKRIIDFVLAERILFALLALGLLSLVLLPLKISALTAFAVCVFGCGIFFFAQINLLVSWIRKYKPLLAATHYAWGSVTWIGGLALGWSVQIAVGYIQGADANANAIVAECLVLAVLLILVSAFSPFGSESDINNAGKAETESRKGEGIWNTALLLLAEEHGLSAKELEVFRYLARGRNAGFIRDEMVLSEHTVKTHIYHIYKKLSINSQQELISVVEDGVKKKKEGDANNLPSQD